jgi:hypothetical protein
MTVKAADHPAVRDGHYVMTGTVYADGTRLLVGTCQCGWRMGVAVNEAATLDGAIEHHWQAAIAADIVARGLS